MTVQEIKSRLTLLSPSEQTEISAFLYHLRHAADPEYQRGIDARLSDDNAAHWLKPEDFERQLDRK